MRRAAAFSLCQLAALVLVAPAGRSEESTITTVPSAQNPPPLQETKILGTPPHLGGRWLAVAALELTDGKHNTLTAFWDVSMRDEPPSLVHRFVDLPPAQKAAMEGLGAEGKAWSPTPDDLAAIAAAWDAAPPIESHVRHVQNSITGKDGFDESLVKEARTRDAIWVIRERLDLHPSGAPVVRYAFVWAAMAATGADYTGNFDGVTIAAAPFPIPISVKGSFRAYQLDQHAPRGGIATRLRDFFRGCGKSGPQ